MLVGGNVLRLDRDIEHNNPYSLCRHTSTQKRPMHPEGLVLVALAHFAESQSCTYAADVLVDESQEDVIEVAMVVDVDQLC